MITNKHQRDKIIKQLDEARTMVRAAHQELDVKASRIFADKAEELIVKGISNLYRLNL